MNFLKYSVTVGRKIGSDNNVKGDFGEMIVSSIFDHRFFGDDELYLINNIYIGSGTDTHQIDHILILFSILLVKYLVAESIQQDKSFRDWLDVSQFKHSFNGCHRPSVGIPLVQLINFVFSIRMYISIIFRRI